jgi:GAF domain-containing protein
MAKRLQIHEAPEITVSFDPNLCKHSGICLRSLPAVFDVRRSRWIQPEAAGANDVVAAVQKCPSGALQFYRNVSRDPAAAELLARRQLLNQLVVSMGREEDRAQAANAICSAIANARGYDFVGLYDVAGAEMAVVGWSGETAPAHPRFPVSQGLCGAAATSRETVIVNDVGADPRYLTTSGTTRAEMIVPVVDPATRETIGTIDVASDRLNAFDASDRELVEDCAQAIHSFWTENV